MRKIGLNYSERLVVLNIQSLESRRKILAMKMVYNLRYSPTKIPLKWSERLIFKQSMRNGLLIKPNYRQIDLIDKNYFNFCIKFFNELPLFIRNESNLKKFVNFLKLHFN